MQSVHCTSAINFKDESHYSFLARANILWTKLKTQNLKIEDLQAYVMLRGALISGDDQEWFLTVTAQLRALWQFNEFKNPYVCLALPFFRKWPVWERGLRKARFMIIRRSLLKTWTHMENMMIQFTWHNMMNGMKVNGWKHWCKRGMMMQSLFLTSRQQRLTSSKPMRT